MNDQTPPQPLTGQPHAPAEPAKPYGSPLRMAQWDHMQMGAFMPLAEDQDVTKKYYGLRHTETFIALLLRNSAGVYHLLSNAVQTPAEGAALKAGPWLPIPMKSSPDGGLLPDPRCKPWDGKAIQEITADKKNKYTCDVQGGGTDVVSFNEKTLEWMSSNGDIEIKGALAAPAMQLILPWREPNGDTDLLFYTAQFYKLDGKYVGEAVNGYSMIEHMWGTKNYATTWWVQNRIVHWPYFTTTYEDGTTEMGDMMYGEFGARAALIVNSKNEIIVNTSEFKAEETKDGGMLYSFANGPQWEFIPEIRVTGFPLAVGMVKRVGETRKIVRSHAMYLSQGPLRAPPAFGQIARKMR